MNVILVIAVIAAALLVLVALVRGLFAFSQNHAESEAGRGHDNRVQQNKMMFARVKWQAITIVLLIIIGVAAGAGNS